MMKTLLVAFVLVIFLGGCSPLRLIFDSIVVEYQDVGIEDDRFQFVSSHAGIGGMALWFEVEGEEQIFVGDRLYYLLEVYGCRHIEDVEYNQDLKTVEIWYSFAVSTSGELSKAGVVDCVKRFHGYERAVRHNMKLAKEREKQLRENLKSFN